MKKIEASANGYTVNVRINRNKWVDILSSATRTADRCDGFQPMNGYTIAQTVMMKIEGFHMPRNGAHDLRKTAASIYAVY